MSCPKCPSSICDWSECFWELLKTAKSSTRHHDDRHLWRCCHWGLHHRSIAFRWIITLDSDALFDRTVEKEMSFENHHVQVLRWLWGLCSLIYDVYLLYVVWHVYLPYPSCAGQVRCFIDFPAHQFPLFFSSSQHFWEHLIPIPFLQRRQHPWHNKVPEPCLNPSCRSRCCIISTQDLPHLATKMLTPSVFSSISVPAETSASRKWAFDRKAERSTRRLFTACAQRKRWA